MTGAVMVTMGEMVNSRMNKRWEALCPTTRIASVAMEIKEKLWLTDFSN